MEFLVEFELNVPEGAPESEVRRRDDAEASATARLADEAISPWPGSSLWQAARSGPAACTAPTAKPGSTPAPGGTSRPSRDRDDKIKTLEVDMSDIEVTRKTSGEARDLKLEVVVLPVSEVDRAKGFYQGLGWRLDADIVRGEDFRVVQLTPPGSACSIIFGTGITSAVPGSADSLILAVQDLEAARADLIGRGADVSDVFHDVGGVFPHARTEGRVPGPDPEGRSYASFASFSDPDGNGWLLQEIKTRLPGR